MMTQKHFGESCGKKKQNGSGESALACVSCFLYDPDGVNLNSQQLPKKITRIMQASVIWLSSVSTPNTHIKEELATGQTERDI